MLPRQWLGTGFVFLGLGLDTVYGKELKPAIPETHNTPSKKPHKPKGIHT